MCITYIVLLYGVHDYLVDFFTLPFASKHMHFDLNGFFHHARVKKYSHAFCSNLLQMIGPFLIAAVYIGIYGNRVDVKVSGLSLRDATSAKLFMLNVGLSIS